MTTQQEIQMTEATFPSWDHMTDLQQAQCMFWDMYKDAHGFRPRGVDTSAWSLEDFGREFDHLGGMIEQQETERMQREQQALVQFEHRLQQLIQLGAADRAEAIRWCLDADQARDLEDLAWINELPWNYFHGQA
jgi:hypothetical protein